LLLADVRSNRPTRLATTTTSVPPTHLRRRRRLHGGGAPRYGAVRRPECLHDRWHLRGRRAGTQGRWRCVPGVWHRTFP